MSAALDDNTRYRLALHAAAMTYVARGWAVVPLSRLTYDAAGHKFVRPLVRWQKDPGQLVRTAEQVEYWFGLTGRAEGVAIATGPSGLLMVDEDAHKDGFAGAELPPGGWREEHAGRGGAHIYYANPDGQRSTAGALGTAIDTRGDGGLAYAAPTRAYHADGRVTQWQTVRPVAELPRPEQLPAGPAAAQRAKNYRPPAAPGEVEMIRPADGMRHVNRWRSEWLASTQGARHHTLMQFAGTYARYLFAAGEPAGDVYAVLEREALAHPDSAEFETVERDLQDAVELARTVRPWVFGEPGGFEGRFTAPDPGDAPVVTADTGDGGELFAGGDPEFFWNPAPPPQPAYGAFGGKLALFYDSGVHWLQGESESGKSWVAFEVVREVLNIGAWVIIVDHEDTRGNVLRRLQALGMTVEQYARLVYVSGQDITHAEVRAHLAETGRDYALMVVDGVTSALNAAGASGRDEQETTRWVDQLPRQARMSICIDHMVKAVDDRRGMAIGTQAKKAVVTGSSWEVAALSPIGRGRSGVIELRLQKDKGGFLRGELGRETVRLDFVSDQGGDRARITAAEPAGGGFFEDPNDAVYGALYADGIDGGVSGRELDREARARGYRGRSSAAGRAALLDGWRTYYANRANTEGSGSVTLPGSRGWVPGVGPGGGSDPAKPDTIGTQ